MPLGRVCRQPERTTNLKGPLNGAGVTPPPLHTPDPAAAAMAPLPKRFRREPVPLGVFVPTRRLGHSDCTSGCVTVAAARLFPNLPVRVVESQPSSGRQTTLDGPAGQRSRLRLKSTSAHTTENPTSAQDRRAASRAAKRRVRLPRVLQSDGGQREGARSSHCHAMLQRRMGYDRFPGVEGDGSSTHARTHARTHGHTPRTHRCTHVPAHTHRSTCIQAMKLTGVRAGGRAQTHARTPEKWGRAMSVSSGSMSTLAPAVAALTAALTAPPVASVVRYASRRRTTLSGGGTR